MLKLDVFMYRDYVAYVANEIVQESYLNFFLYIIIVVRQNFRASITEVLYTGARCFQKTIELF